MEQQVLGSFREQAGSSLKCAVAGALAEMGGERAIPVLSSLAVGPRRDSDTAVRAAVLEALGSIGGAAAVDVLSDAAETDEDATVGSVAVQQIGALGEHEPERVAKVLNRLRRSVAEGPVRDRVIAELACLG